MNVRGNSFSGVAALVQLARFVDFLDNSRLGLTSLSVTICFVNEFMLVTNDAPKTNGAVLRQLPRFIYRFLQKAGFNSRQMRIEVSPSAQGSAEQWVRRNYVRQMKICRARIARAATGMFVFLDADNKSVQEHLRELDAALIAENQQKFNSATDKIARLIPKWSVETWILFLSSNGVHTPPLSENEPYKSLKATEQWSGLIPKASETLLTWTKDATKVPNNLLDSLQLALQEIPRALPAGK